MTQQSRFRESLDLMVAVERLSTQDQRRIVHLIHLLRQAPDVQRRRLQAELRELIAQSPQSHADCLASIDRLIASVERGLARRLRVVAGGKRQANHRSARANRQEPDGSPLPEGPRLATCRKSR